MREIEKYAIRRKWVWRDDLCNREWKGSGIYTEGTEDCRLPRLLETIHSWRFDFDTIQLSMNLENWLQMDCKTHIAQVALKHGLRKKVASIKKGHSIDKNTLCKRNIVAKLCSQVKYVWESGTICSALMETNKGAWQRHSVLWLYFHVWTNLVCERDEKPELLHVMIGSVDEKYSLTNNIKWICIRLRLFQSFLHYYPMLLCSS